MWKRICLAAVLMGAGVHLATPSGAQVAPAGSAWRHLGAVAAPAHPLIEPKAYAAFALDRASFDGALRPANTSRAVRVAIPAPDGTVDHFDVVDSPVMEPGLAREYPQIRTYA